MVSKLSMLAAILLAITGLVACNGNVTKSEPQASGAPSPVVDSADCIAEGIDEDFKYSAPSSTKPNEKSDSSDSEPQSDPDFADCIMPEVNQ
jgi:hypothetical protein